MAEKPQFYQEYKRADVIQTQENRLKNLKAGLQNCKDAIEAIKAEVDADADSTADMVTLATQAYNLVNNATYTDFIAFLDSNVN